MRFNGPVPNDTPLQSIISAQLDVCPHLHPETTIEVRGMVCMGGYFDEKIGGVASSLRWTERRTQNRYNAKSQENPEHTLHLSDFAPWRKKKESEQK